MTLVTIQHNCLGVRQENRTTETGIDKSSIIVVGVVVGFIVMLALLFSLYRNRRTSALNIRLRVRHLWIRIKKGAAYSPDDVHGQSRYSRSGAPSLSQRGSNDAYQDPAVSELRRDSSLRSVLTLPTYDETPRPTERVLGRAGDRADVDVVVEYPETPEAAEARREAEMASLYSIREAGRRARNDALRNSQSQVRRPRSSISNATTIIPNGRASSTASMLTDVTGTSNPSIQTLLENHREQQATRDRERPISAVLYADLGVARHDGTRLRANSVGSDDSSMRPLLREGFVGIDMDMDMNDDRNEDNQRRRGRQTEDIEANSGIRRPNASIIREAVRELAMDTNIWSGLRKGGRWITRRSRSTSIPPPTTELDVQNMPSSLLPDHNHSTVPPPPNYDSITISPPPPDATADSLQSPTQQSAPPIRVFPPHSVEEERRESRHTEAGSAEPPVYGSTNRSSNSGSLDGVFELFNIV